MTLAAVNIQNEMIGKRIYRLDLVFVKYVAAAKLPTIATTPREEKSFLIYRGSMIVAKR